MFYDADGNEMGVGYIGYYSFEITAVTSTGFQVQGGISGTTINVPNIGPDSHQGGKGTWPGVPGA